MAANEKTRENRLRRMADRQGLRLSRSHARDPHDITFGGYQLFELEHGSCAFGWGNVNRGFAASLDDIEQFLTSDDRGRTPMTRPTKGTRAVKQISTRRREKIGK